MPVARIFTIHPERTDTLARQLESEGYSVEIVRPESPAAPADLEIDFEIWPEERALYRAAELAERLHADVCVAPGLDLNRLEAQHQPGPVQQTGTGPAQVLPPVPEVKPSPAPPAPGPVVVPFRKEEQGSALKANAPQEDASVPPAVWMAAAGPSQPPPQSASKEPVSESEQQSGPRRLHAPLVPEQPAMAQRAGRAWLSAWSAARKFAHECKQRMDLRWAEFRMSRQQRRLELEKRKLVAQERAKELQAAREAASARLQELLRERGGEPAAPAASGAEAVSTPPPAAVPEMGLWKTRLSVWLSHRPPARAVLAGVAAVAVLFALGLALKSFWPHPASSRSAHQSEKGVTVHTGGVTLKPSLPEKTTPRPSPAVRSQSASAKPVTAHKTAGITVTNFGDDVTVRHFAPQKNSRQRTRVNQNGAGDVTIRHISPQKAKPSPKNQPQAELKHISDLDN